MSGDVAEWGFQRGAAPLTLGEKQTWAERQRSPVRHMSGDVAERGFQRGAAPLTLGEKQTRAERQRSPVRGSK